MRSANSNLFFNENKTELEQQFRQAAWKGDLDTVKSLLSKVDINAAGKETGRTALHRAMERGRIPVICFLLEQKVNINYQDKEGNTPLHLFFMTQPKTQETIEMLPIITLGPSVAEHGFTFNPHLKNTAGKTIANYIYPIFLQLQTPSQLCFCAITMLRTAAEKGLRKDQMICFDGYGNMTIHKGKNLNFNQPKAYSDAENQAIAEARERLRNLTSKSHLNNNK